MNLKEKSQTVARSYDEITADVEKYILAAINVINDKDPGTIECDKIGFGGSTDANHTHIIVDGKSEVVIDLEGDKIKVTLDRTGESVILNDKDAQDVYDLFIVPLRAIMEKNEESYPAIGMLGHILAMPLVIGDLKKAGKDPMDITPRELKKLIDAKIEEIKNSK